MPLQFPRFIARSTSNGPTARRLVTLLDGRRTVSPYLRTAPRVDHSLDLLTFYPDITKVDNPAPSYRLIREFFTRDKKGQRGGMFDMGLPIVPTKFGSEWLGGTVNDQDRIVVRPLRHRGGREFHVLPKVELDGLPHSNKTYYSKLIEKTDEFRILYFRGQRVATYRKTNPNCVPADQPWNHSSGTSFHTIRNSYNDPLPRSFYTALENSILVQGADLLAFDVLWDGQPYITEVNFAPGITIQASLDKIKVINSELGARA